jgi:hypothetical protein
MDHFEAFGRSGAAEVGALDERGAQPSQGRVSRGCGAERSCADYEYVEFFADESRRVALHAIHLGNDNACDARSVPRSCQNLFTPGCANTVVRNLHRVTRRPRCNRFK